MKEPAWLTSRLASTSFLLPRCLQYVEAAVHEMAGLTFVSNTACFYRSHECRSLSLLLCLLPSCWVVPPSVPCRLLGFQHVQWSSGNVLAPLGKPVQRHLHTAQPEGRGLRVQCYSCTIWPVGGVSFSSCASEHVLFDMI